MQFCAKCCKIKILLSVKYAIINKCETTLLTVTEEYLSKKLNFVKSLMGSKSINIEMLRLDANAFHLLFQQKKSIFVPNLQVYFYKVALNS